jgi:uncharacterized membrane protein
MMRFVASWQHPCRCWPSIHAAPASAALRIQDHDTMAATLDTLFDPLILSHTIAAGLALVGGVAMITMRKGTRVHRLLGRVWVATMLVTAGSSLLIRATVMPIGRFGPIHLLSLLSLSAVIGGSIAIRRGQLVAHRQAMIQAFVGLAIAGLFTLTPGRTLNLWAHELLARASVTTSTPATASRFAQALRVPGQ